MLDDDLILGIIDLLLLNVCSSLFCLVPAGAAAKPSVVRTFEPTLDMSMQSGLISSLDFLYVGSRRASLSRIISVEVSIFIMLFSSLLASASPLESDI
jgi:hypothetical protein